jgi:hypothetical protein
MQKKPRLILLILILLFFGPMFGAWYLYTTQKSGVQLLKKTTNHGTLIQPPLTLAQLSLPNTGAGKWLVIYIASLPCASECQKILYKMRQVRLTLGKDQNRVQRVILRQTGQPMAELPPEYAGTWHWQTDLMSQPRLSPENLYLIDPLGNIILQYPQDIAPKDLKDDIVRLLKTSRIG